MKEDKYTEEQHAMIIKALIKGEQSGTVKDFDRDKFMKYLHEKYLDENGKLKKPNKR